jgi:hypothetical protein
MEPGSGDDGREALGDDGAEWPTVVVDPRASSIEPDHRTKATPRLPRAYVKRRDSPHRADSIRPSESLDAAAPEEGADLATALEPHLAWLAEPDRSELFLVLLKGQFALAISMLKEHSDRFPKNVSILRAMQMVERVAIHHFIGKLRPLDRVPVVVHRAPGRTVTSAVTELLKLCDGVASLEEILRRSQSARLPTLQILLRLVERGTIVLSRPRHRALLDDLSAIEPPPPPSEPGPELYGQIEGRATMPDPVEMRYQAALMRSPSGSLPKTTLRGMQPLESSNGEALPNPVEPEATQNTPPLPAESDTDPAERAPRIELDARPVRTPIAVGRNALFSIPNLEVPPASIPPAPPFRQDSVDVAEYHTDEPTMIPSERSTFGGPDVESFERSRRWIRVGVGLAIASAGLFVLVLWARSTMDRETSSPASVEPERGGARVEAKDTPAAPTVDPGEETTGETVRLSVEISPAYATVTVDGESLRAPYRTELPRADVEHVIEVAAAGYQSRTVSVTANRDATLIIALEPLPPKKPKKKPAASPDPPPADVDPYE